MNIMPDSWLCKIKQTWPKFCWAELVIWNIGDRHSLLQIFHPEDHDMNIGSCHKEVEKYGHGWCGHCQKLDKPEAK